MSKETERIIIEEENIDKIKITNKAFLEALETAGGEARITPLYEAFNKTAYPDVAPAKLKTALRVKGKKLAENPIVQAIHVDGKRIYIFKLVEL